MMCKSKEIIFNIDNTNGNYSKFTGREFPFYKIIEENMQMCCFECSDTDVLAHSFKSDVEFLFSYSFDKHYKDPIKKNSILSIFEAQKNLIQTKHSVVSDHLENY